jgi:hypothetical protein
MPDPQLDRPFTVPVPVCNTTDMVRYLEGNILENDDGMLGRILLQQRLKCHSSLKIGNKNKKKIVKITFTVTVVNNLRSITSATTTSRKTCQTNIGYRTFSGLRHIV